MLTKRILVVGYLFSLLLINLHTTESISHQEDNAEAITINEQKQIRRGRRSGNGQNRGRRRRNCDPLYRYLFETCGQWPFSTTPSPDNPFLPYQPPFSPSRPRPSPRLPPPPLVPSPPPPPPSPLVPSPPPPVIVYVPAPLVPSPPPPQSSGGDSMMQPPPIFTLPPPEDEFPPMPPITWLPPPDVTTQSFDQIPPPLV